MQQRPLHRGAVTHTSTCTPVQETGAQVHFIDDRLETLEHMASEPTLRDVRLYFATWGYSTPEEKARARNIRGEGGDSRDIVPIDLEGFGELLRWGIVMGVDDGCEPEVSGGSAEVVCEVEDVGGNWGEDNGMVGDTQGLMTCD